MKITTSDNYYDHCGDCDRAYCNTHRLLWRFCETAQKGMDDTYTNGKPHYIYEWGDCPICESESRAKQAAREFQAWERRQKEAHHAA